MLCSGNEDDNAPTYQIIQKPPSLSIRQLLGLDDRDLQKPSEKMLAKPSFKERETAMIIDSSS